MAGLAGAAGALGNIKNLGDFDAAARKANTLTDDIDALKKGAFELAKEIKNTATATEILNAAEPVLSSGITKTTDVLKVLKAAQIGAVGGFSDIETVADATTTIMASFGLSADKAAGIVQRMAGVQNAGKIQVGQYAGQVGKLTGAIALFGGTYDKAGLSMAEVDGLISNATAKGVRVSSAFDGIRQAISSIGAPTKEASDEAKKLGIQFDAVTLQSKGLTGILQSLSGSKGAAKELDAIAAASAKAAKAAGGIDTDAGKAAAAKAGQEAAKSAASMLKLFGSVEAVSALAASSGKQGLLDLAKSMEVAAKTDASAAFEKVRNGINQQKKAFENRAIDLDVKIKSGFVGDIIGAGLGIANKAMDAIIDTVEKLNQAYVRLSPQAQGVVKAIGGVVAITATVTAGIIAVGAAVAVMGGVEAT
jgi:TP901 family phage tail tape measure protein